MTTQTQRTKGTERLTDKAIRAWLGKAQPMTEPQDDGATTGARKVDGRDTLHDGGGLYLKRRAEGAFWSLRQVNQITGARTWAGLFPGVPYPTATLSEARRKAAEARLRAAAAPTDVVRERKAALTTVRAETAAAEKAERERVTMRALFEQWQRAELTPHTRADGTRTGRKDGGQWVLDSFERRLFPRLGSVTAKDVRKTDLLCILDDCKAGGQRRTANVLLADLRQMFRFAADRDIVARNPLDGIKRATIGGKDVERERTLSDAELKALRAAVPVANMTPRSEAAVWLILATACRVGEAMAARWEHVDMVARTWHLPDTKNERPHTIHLSDFALRQIEALLALRVNGKDGKPVPWLFPNAASDGPVCVKSFGKQLADRQRDQGKPMANRAKDTASLVLAGGRWTAHDLRRTAATLMAGLGISTDVIDECLNHKLQSKVARVYIKDRRLTEQARAFDALGAKLAAVVDGAVASNVVQLRAA